MVYHPRGRNILFLHSNSGLAENKIFALRLNSHDIPSGTLPDGWSYELPKTRRRIPSLPRSQLLPPFGSTQLLSLFPRARDWKSALRQEGHTDLLPSFLLVPHTVFCLPRHWPSLRDACPLPSQWHGEGRITNMGSSSPVAMASVNTQLSVTVCVTRLSSPPVSYPPSLLLPPRRSHFYNAFF